MATCGKEIRIGDIGTDFRITLYECDEIVDISSMINGYIYLQKPDGTLLTKPASLFTDGTDGIIHYESIAGDLDQKGTWKIQGKVWLPSGEWGSDIEKFKVYENLF